jgi:hypothetical protein
MVVTKRWTEAEIAAADNCWCGTRNPYFAPLPDRCGGDGHLDCLCGGDFCVCHNHGDMECFGCEDCEPDDD